jgi:maltooligosyltrehalose trehalohydrolase
VSDEPAAGPGGLARRPGPTPRSDGSCSFVVWAPYQSAVGVQLLGPGPARRVEALHGSADGYFSATVADCPDGTRYRYVLADGSTVPDPASRWQPEGVHGPSAVFDPGRHHWTDHSFVAPGLDQLVISEVHLGTFTDEGTFDAAGDHLAEAADLGITAIELMPVAQFPGRWNWGYDGVFPYATQNTYGGPAGLQRFVDACHHHGLAVVLDVVYNHLGPEGNILDAFGPYFTDRYTTPWGPAVNVDGADSDPVRHYFIDNARWWLEDLHVDALRLDAVHSILDTTATPFLADLSAAVDRWGARLGRHLLLVAESADNDPRVVAPRAGGGLGLQAQWNDDFHHALHAVITGETTGYYADFGRLDQLAVTIDRGFYFQGEYSRVRRRRHGAPSDSIAPDQLVIFAQNHDHIGNRPAGDRLATLVPLAAQRLAAAILLLSPGVPLLFMGEEYGETAPFPFFVDHGDAGLAAAVRSGRAEEMAALTLPGEPLDPTDPSTRDVAVLDRSLRQDPDHSDLVTLHRGLLRFRRQQVTFAAATRSSTRAWAVGPVLTVVRTAGSDRTAALFNLGSATASAILPDPPTNSPGTWTPVLDARDPGLGGHGPTDPAPVDRGAVPLEPYGFTVYAWGGTGEPPDPSGHRKEAHSRACLAR